VAWADRVAKARAEGMAALTGFQLDRWFSDAFRARRPDLCDATLALFADTDLQGYADACTALGAMDLRQAIGSIACPTVVVVGEHDLATPVAHAEDLHRRIAGSSLHVIPGCKHLSAVERPAAVLGHLAAAAGA
jgi:3-oxoadipate enol-lactonase